MERRKGTESPLRLTIIDPSERIDDRFDAAEFHVGRTRTGTADGASPRSSSAATLRRLVRMGAAAKVAILVVVNCSGTPRANLTHQIQILESTVQSAWWIGRRKNEDRHRRRSQSPFFLNRSVVQEKSWRDLLRAGQLANPWPAAWPVPCPSINRV